MHLKDFVVRRRVHIWYGYSRNDVPHFHGIALCVNCCRVTVIRMHRNGSVTVHVYFKVSGANVVRRRSEKSSNPTLHRFNGRRYTAVPM